MATEFLTLAKAIFKGIDLPASMLDEAAQALKSGDDLSQWSQKYLDDAGKLTDEGKQLDSVTRKLLQRGEFKDALRTGDMAQNLRSSFSEALKTQDSIDLDDLFDASNIKSSRLDDETINAFRARFQQTLDYRDNLIDQAIEKGRFANREEALADFQNSVTPFRKPKPDTITETKDMAEDLVAKGKGANFIPDYHFAPEKVLSALMNPGKQITRTLFRGLPPSKSVPQLFADWRIMKPITQKMDNVIAETGLHESVILLKKDLKEITEALSSGSKINVQTPTGVDSVTVTLDNVDDLIKNRFETFSKNPENIAALDTLSKQADLLMDDTRKMPIVPFYSHVVGVQNHQMESLKLFASDLKHMATGLSDPNSPMVSEFSKKISALSTNSRTAGNTVDIAKTLDIMLDNRLDRLGSNVYIRQNDAVPVIKTGADGEDLISKGRRATPPEKTKLRRELAAGSYNPYTRTEEFLPKDNSELTAIVGVIREFKQYQDPVTGAVDWSKAPQGYASKTAGKLIEMYRSAGGAEVNANEAVEIILMKMGRDAKSTLPPGLGDEIRDRMRTTADPHLRHFLQKLYDSTKRVYDDDVAKGPRDMAEKAAPWLEHQFIARAYADNQKLWGVLPIQVAKPTQNWLGRKIFDGGKSAFGYLTGASIKSTDDGRVALSWKAADKTEVKNVTSKNAQGETVTTQKMVHADDVSFMDRRNAVSRILLRGATGGAIDLKTVRYPIYGAAAMGLGYGLFTNTEELDGTAQGNKDYALETLKDTASWASVPWAWQSRVFTGGVDFIVDDTFGTATQLVTSPFMEGPGLDLGVDVGGGFDYLYENITGLNALDMGIPSQDTETVSVSNPTDDAVQTQNPNTMDVAAIKEASASNVAEAEKLIKGTQDAYAPAGSLAAQQNWVYRTMGYNADASLLDNLQSAKDSLNNDLNGKIRLATQDGDTEKLAQLNKLKTQINGDGTDQNPGLFATYATIIAQDKATLDAKLDDQLEIMRQKGTFIAQETGKNALNEAFTAQNAAYSEIQTLAKISDQRALEIEALVTSVNQAIATSTPIADGQEPEVTPLATILNPPTPTPAPTTTGTNTTGTGTGTNTTGTNTSGTGTNTNTTSTTTTATNPFLERAQPEIDAILKSVSSLSTDPAVLAKYWGEDQRDLNKVIAHRDGLLEEANTENGFAARKLRERAEGMSIGIGELEHNVAELKKISDARKGLLEAHKDELEQYKTDALKLKTELAASGLSEEDAAKKIDELKDIREKLTSRIDEIFKPANTRASELHRLNQIIFTNDNGNPQEPNAESEFTLALDEWNNTLQGMQGGKNGLLTGLFGSSQPGEVSQAGSFLGGIGKGLKDAFNYVAPGGELSKSMGQTKSGQLWYQGLLLGGSVIAGMMATSAINMLPGVNLPRWLTIPAMIGVAFLGLKAGSNQGEEWEAEATSSTARLSTNPTQSGSNGGQNLPKAVTGGGANDNTATPASAVVTLKNAATGETVGHVISATNDNGERSLSIKATTDQNGNLKISRDVAQYSDEAKEEIFAKATACGSGQHTPNSIGGGNVIALPTHNGNGQDAVEVQAFCSATPVDNTVSVGMGGR